MIDLEKIKKLLNPECITCNVAHKYKYKLNCPNCIFTCDSFTRSLFKETGLTKSIYKHHLYYFIYNPELEFKYPDLPDYDYLNNHKNKYKENIWNWDIHHEDGNHWNDNQWNLLLVLKTEHHSIHWSLYNPSFVKEIVDKRSKKIKETHQKKVNNGTHWLLHNNPMKDPITAKKSVEIRGEQIHKLLEIGQHHFQIKNPKIDYNKIDKIKEWFDIIESGYKIRLTSTLAYQFGYCSLCDFRKGLESLIKRDNIDNIILDHNGLKSKLSKWYIIKEDSSCES